MKEVVCNYAIARFRPYRETGEFVNVGIVLICPQLDFFGYLFEKRKYKRITDFFPELEVEVFKAGLGGMLKELTRVTGMEQEQYVLHEEAKANLGRFRELVRPRETLFYFGETGTVFAQNPQDKLKELFEYYVNRQFAKDREYQEVIMRRQLGRFLHEFKLDQFYKTDRPIGDESYRVTIPFVHFANSKALKAIKPLHLAKGTPTEIYRHGDAWISSVRRLRQINWLPKEMLFTVKFPKENGKLGDAAEQICNELQALDTLTIPFSDSRRIRDFAAI